MQEQQPVGGVLSTFNGWLTARLTASFDIAQTGFQSLRAYGCCHGLRRQPGLSTAILRAQELHQRRPLRLAHVEQGIKTVVPAIDHDVIRLGIEHILSDGNGGHVGTRVALGVNKQRADKGADLGLAIIRTRLIEMVLRNECRPLSDPFQVFTGRP